MRQAKREGANTNVPTMMIGERVSDFLASGR